MRGQTRQKLRPAGGCEHTIPVMGLCYCSRDGEDQRVRTLVHSPAEVVDKQKAHEGKGLLLTPELLWPLSLPCSALLLPPPALQL